MSQYSYHYSQHQEDQGNFLENIAMHFEIHKFDSSASSYKNQPTNYSDRPLSSIDAPRSFSFLDLSEEKREAYLAARRGLADQTMQLHPNFKTLTRRRLKELIYLKLLGEKQYKNCLEYMRSSPSFRNLRALLLPQADTHQLRTHLLQFYSSSKVICMILRSHISHTQKLRMIKFVEKLRQALTGGNAHNKWKGI